MIVEIRSYRLHEGTRAQFARLFAREALPMLRRWQVDVVAHGPSRHDETSYFLLRTYADLGQRQESQNAFYGSDEWRQGPREAILACIESYIDVVLDVDERMLRELRRFDVESDAPSSRV